MLENTRIRWQGHSSALSALGLIESIRAMQRADLVDILDVTLRVSILRG